MYDIEPYPGEVTEAGTAVNRALFNALQNDIPLASYMAFCGNVNADMLDAAFGKGNEGRVNALGKQLTMYAWFKGTDKTSSPFANLITKNAFAECLSSPEALSEILSNSHITSLINTSPYAKTLYDNTDIGKLVAYFAGLNPDDYADMAAVAASETAMAAVAASSTAMNAVIANEAAMAAVAASSAAMTAVAASSAAMTAVAASSTAMNAVIANEAAMTAVAASSAA